MAPLTPGNPSPGFVLPLSEDGNKSFDLTQTLEKSTLLLAFMKEECPTCRLTAPFLERLQRKLNSPNFQLVAVMQNLSAEAKAFAKHFDLSFPMALDTQPYAVSNAYGITAVPTLFLIQPNGKVQKSVVGFDKNGLEALAQEIAKDCGHTPITLFEETDQVPLYKPG